MVNCHVGSGIVCRRGSTGLNGSGGDPSHSLGRGVLGDGNRGERRLVSRVAQARGAKVREGGGGADLTMHWRGGIHLQTLRRGGLGAFCITRCQREINFHLGFTGLVQLRDGLFQLFLGEDVRS